MSVGRVEMPELGKKWMLKKRTRNKGKRQKQGPKAKQTSYTNKYMK